jgi:dipeptidyl aminopeptidase/acylaminoacyl peptidase
MTSLSNRSTTAQFLKVALVASLLFLILISTLSMKQPVRGAFPGANGKILFQRSGDIYVMNANGSALVRLTDTPKDDLSAAWSADGKKIVFQSTRDDPKDEIYVMNSDGTSVSRITNNGFVDGFPSWSPDGSRIAFESNRTGNTDVYSIGADGSGESRLTNSQALDGFPSWSPDGMRIAFETYRDGNWEIYVMNADGSNQINLTKDNNWDLDPNWSPDGSKIIFASGRSGLWEVYVMNADGSSQTKLTSSARSVSNRFPSWSPDGKKIVFQTNRDGDWEIYVMNAADGTMVTRLTTWAGGNGHPDWQPLEPVSQVRIEPTNYVTRSELLLYLAVFAAIVIAIVLISGRRVRKSAPSPSDIRRTTPSEISNTSTASRSPGPATKHCIKCGSEMSGRAKFCGKCGSTQA